MFSSRGRWSEKDALQTLYAVNGEIYDTIVGLSMSGDLKAWNESVPVGEEHQLDFDLFRNSTDMNVKALVAVTEKIDKTYHSICNLNGIPQEVRGKE